MTEISPAQQGINHARRAAAHQTELSNKQAALRELQSRLANSKAAALRGDAVLGSEALQTELAFRVENLQRDVASLEARCAAMADWRD